MATPHPRDIPEEVIEPGAPPAAPKKLPKPGVAPKKVPVSALPLWLAQSLAAEDMKEQPAVTPKLKRPGVAPRHSYSPNEVKEMDDNRLCVEFVRLTGHTHLVCSCCRKRSIDTHWIHSIRKRAMKKGLSGEMPIPKTCDAQQFRNQLCNPINNPAYSKIYRGVTDEEKESIIQSRQEQLVGISIATRPYRHIV